MEQPRQGRVNLRKLARRVRPKFGSDPGDGLVLQKKDANLTNYVIDMQIVTTCFALSQSKPNFWMGWGGKG
jgi:hypothetical protein